MRLMLKLPVLTCGILLFTLLCQVVYGQMLTGRVVDAVNAKPVANASVYLDGSSVGTTTNAEGEFIIRSKSENLPLVVSCIGYETETIKRYGSNPLLIKLSPKSVVLKEVTIGGIPREKQLAIFLNEFIGSPADGITLVNPDDLDFSYSKKSNSLTATADKPLQIINKRTGYKITYFLNRFLHNDTITSFRGNYFFAEDTAGLKKADLKRIAKAREGFYYGSKTHFIRSLWMDDLRTNKFQIVTSRYSDGQIIPAKSILSVNKDDKYITYKKPVYIIYRDNPRRWSSLKLGNEVQAAIIDKDGYYDPSINWSGEMASQRIAQLLPFEYGLSANGGPALIPEPPPEHVNFDSLLNLYALSRRSPALYIHFDKNVYSNNENVWFTGYMLNYADTVRYKTLSIALVRNNDRHIVLDERFSFNGAFCFGNTTLPDSVRAGAYTFVAYASRLKNGKPDVLFTQQITVKTETVQSFNASLNPLDTSATAASQKVMLLVSFTDAKSAPASVLVTYYIGDSRKPIVAGAVKTTLGQHIFSIPSNLLSEGNNTLNVQIMHKKEVQEIKMRLPVPSKPPIINFFPEGGNLVSGVPNLVGWEAKSTAGAPLFAEAMLLEDDKIIDTIATRGNGLGRFYMVPTAGKKYTIKLVADKYNTIYKLPDAVNSATLFVKHAVVNDTLVVDVYNNDANRKLYLLGHNYEDLFFEVPVEKQPVQRVRIILSNVPRGLKQLSLVDSAGNAYAARTFFAHYNNKSSLEITPDNESYSSRKKVKINIKLEGNDNNAAVSIAVVQANRLEIQNKSDIESYLYLKSNLKGIPVKERYFDNTEFAKRDMEDVLLIKGWSRYKWTDVLKIQPPDTFKVITEPVFTAEVSHKYGKLKKPVTVVSINPPAAFETKPNGTFLLPDSNIITQPGKNVSLMVADAVPSDFTIKVINPYDSLNNYVAGLFDPDIYHSPAAESSKLLQIPVNERAIRLKEVVIRDKKVSTELSNFLQDTNPCGNYVCQNGVHNCPNHPPPGCRLLFGKSNVPEPRPNATQFKGIFAAQEFYPSDYSETSPSQPEYQSTIYWKSQLMLKNGEMQEVSFYTSDITGQFKVIVQGISNTDVLHAETSFKVSK